jgi:hypothetical protein
VRYDGNGTPLRPATGTNFRPSTSSRKRRMPAAEAGA